MRRISTLITVTSAKKGFSNFPTAHNGANVEKIVPKKECKLTLRVHASSVL